MQALVNENYRNYKRLHTVFVEERVGGSSSNPVRGCQWLLGILLAISNVVCRHFPIAGINFASALQASLTNKSFHYVLNNALKCKSGHGEMPYSFYAMNDELCNSPTLAAARRHGDGPPTSWMPHSFIYTGGPSRRCREYFYLISCNFQESEVSLKT